MINYFENFKKYAFRLELLQSYSVEGETKDFQNFLRDGKVDPKKNAQWHEIISKAKSRGAGMSRVHVVKKPYTDYIKYEMEAYKFNELAGEEIFIIDDRKIDLKIGFDFWLFDDEIVLKMNYSKEGKFLGFEKIRDDIYRYIELKNELLKKAKRVEFLEGTK